MKIGIIGAAGGMGRTYAKAFAAAGHTVLVHDVRRRELRKLSGKNVVVCRNQAEVLGQADVTFYSTPIFTTHAIIRETARYAKKGAVLGGFTSVKRHEVAALKESAPAGVSIVTVHPLHAPTPNVAGHTVAIVGVRGKRDAVRKVDELFRELGTKTINVSANRHDRVMADTQALTHFTLLTMALAWKMRGFHPQDNPNYASSVDALKADMALRILAQNPEVYAGIALLNPHVLPQIRAYVRALHDITEAIHNNDTAKLRRFWRESAEYLGKPKIREADATTRQLFASPYKAEGDPNSHISLLAMALAWKRLGIKHSEVEPLQTPPYRVRSLLVHKIMGGRHERYVRNALENPEIRQDDLAFVAAANTWLHVIESGDMWRYTRLFGSIREFYGGERIASAKTRTDQLIGRQLRGK
jgi:prephenate dehydrogenase (NADP+)